MPETANQASMTEEPGRFPWRYTVRLAVYFLASGVFLVAPWFHYDILHSLANALPVLLGTVILGYFSMPSLAEEFRRRDRDAWIGVGVIAFCLTVIDAIAYGVHGPATRPLSLADVAAINLSGLCASASIVMANLNFSRLRDAWNSEAYQDWEKKRDEGWINGPALCASLGIADPASAKNLLSRLPSVSVPHEKSLYAPLSFEQLVERDDFIEAVVSVCGANRTFALRCMTTEQGRAKAIAHLLCHGDEAA